jgi:dolichol-phosphate mannosyltransferase
MMHVYRNSRSNCHLSQCTRSPELSVIVPTFNEAPNVELVVEALVASLRGIDWEVIFVDDDSSDGTTNTVRHIARCDGRVRCIRRIGRRGLAGASIEGMLSSSAPVIAIMDGDMQHDVSLLPEILRRTHLEQWYDKSNTRFSR